MMVVPEPEKVSSTISPRRVQSGRRIQDGVEKARVIRGRHFPARHGELGVFGFASTDHSADPQIVRYVKKSHIGWVSTHELGNVIGAPRVATHQLMIS